MKERGILFSAPMVRAILAGTKTQTRRIIKPVQPRDDGMWPAGRDPVPDCPYGRLGDRLWVRETHALENRYGNVWCKYAADGHHAVVTAPELVTVARPGMRPSIHMPRWASRITLEITAVRVERLQDISAADCWAEGMPMSPDVNPIHDYQDLWEQINGPGSWNADPWVWVIEFRRV